MNLFKNEMKKETLTRDEYFMSVAIVTSQRSHDPVLQVGACLVGEKDCVIGTGYNCMPQALDDRFPWIKESYETLSHKSLFICHAEMNAILNAKGATQGSTLYVTLHPCKECAKIMVQAGVKEVVYLNDRHGYKAKYRASKHMFDIVGVKHRKYQVTGREFKCKL